MATARQCKKVIGLDWDNLEYSVADWAVTGEIGGAGISAATYVYFNLKNGQCYKFLLAHTKN